MTREDAHMNAVDPTRSPPRPWWQFGHVWLVIAGPALVVLAGFFTYYLAVRSPDPVLSTSTAGPQGSGASQGGGISQAPAVQARNHAATGVLPAPTATPKP